jgi:hypothetical protein
VKKKKMKDNTKNNMRKSVAVILFVAILMATIMVMAIAVPAMAEEVVDNAPCNDTYWDSQMSILSTAPEFNALGNPPAMAGGDVWLRFDNAHCNNFYPFSTSSGQLGKTYYANFTATDDLYTEVYGYKCCLPGWCREHFGRPDLVRMGPWVAERKRISDSKYMILIRGASQADCACGGNGYVSGEAQVLPESGWKITEMNKCEVNPDSRGRAVYCEVNKGTGKIKFAGGSTCIGCCCCIDSGQINITVTVERGIPMEKLIKDYFPYYYFSIGEPYYPCSFYFDNDSFVDNNKENYDARKGMWNESYVYIHTVEDDTYLTIQYWLYSVFNHHDIWFDHEHDWDAIVFVVFDKGDLSQPIEVRMAYHYFVGVYFWEDVEKIDDTHVVAYVAEGSHGAYNSSTTIKMVGFPELDKWTPGGDHYTPDDFNWYLVCDCTGEVWRGPFLGIPVFRRFCDVTNQLTRGDAQYEPVEGYWPRGYHGKGADGEAPWHDDRWFTTKPEGPWGVTEFSVNCPVDLHIYDPLGRHVGINYETGEPEIEIPNATCSIELEGQYITIFDPIEGDYRVEIVGLENGTYNFSMVCSNYMKFIDWVEHKDVQITKDEKQTFTLNPWMPYGIWANSTSHPEAIRWSGSKTVVNGKVHSNDGIKVSGSTNMVDGITSYTSTFEDSGSENIYIPSPVQVSIRTIPVYYDIEDYKPGGTEAIAAGTNYHYIDGKFHVSDSDVALDGLYYVTDEVELSGSNISGVFTIVAEGKIDVSGSELNCNAYSSDLLFMSNDTKFKIPGSKSFFGGIIYIPKGEIDISGSTNTINGSLVGNTVKLSGSMMHINAIK